MISIMEAHFGLDVSLFNECTIADFKQFEEGLKHWVQEHGQKPDLLVDLSELHDFTIDMAFELLRFLHSHEIEFGRIAVVVNDLWIKIATRISSLFSKTRFNYFQRFDQAKDWINSSP